MKSHIVTLSAKQIQDGITDNMETIIRGVNEDRIKAGKPRLTPQEEARGREVCLPLVIEAMEKQLGMTLALAQINDLKAKHAPPPEPPKHYVGERTSSNTRRSFFDTVETTCWRPSEVSQPSEAVTTSRQSSSSDYSPPRSTGRSYDDYGSSDRQVLHKGTFMSEHDLRVNQAWNSSY